MFPEILKKNLITILLHPASLAIPVALVVIWLTPDVFDKYTISLQYEYIHELNTTFEYHDLDHDGISEWFAAQNTNQNTSGIAIHNQKGIIFHWHFEGYFLPEQPKCMVGDADNDGHDEIYAFTLKGDSLLMHCIDYRRYPELTLKNVFIARIPGEKPEYNVRFTPGKITDLDGDGFKEIVFSVNTGYGGAPRKVFAYNIRKRKFISSIELGASLGELYFADINKDNFDEIFVSNYGPGNINDMSQKMRDSCSYLIVLDHNLNFLFPPVINLGLYNGVNCVPFRTNQGTLIAAIFRVVNQSKGSPSIRLYNKKGELVKQKELDIEHRDLTVSVRPIDDGHGEPSFLFISSPGDLSLMNKDLVIIKKTNIQIGGELYQYDLDHDGTKELLYSTTIPGQWVILRSNFKYPVHFTTDITNKVPYIFTILKGVKKPQFSFQLGNRQSVFEYGFNPMYYWQFLIYFGIYFGVLVFILLIRRIQKIQLQKKYETEKRIAELQYVSLQNQISPHFTFNVLNTIGSAINQEKKDDAYQLLLKFSKLLRTLLTNPETVTRPLKEELEFVTNFLEIQKHRFKNVFTYKIDLYQKVDMDQLIPKSCIQTYVENALKHGIAPMKLNGEIIITITKQEKNLEIIVTDNGVGRANSAKTSSTSTGRGLKIMHQYYELFNKANKEPIMEEFKDLTDSAGNPAGTEVIIRIPDDFRFSLSSVSNK